MFRNLRAYLPPDLPFAGNLTRDDVPTEFLTNAWFEQWDYFQANRWTEREDHEAEEFFYAQGGKASKYPGPAVVKRLWAESKGFYKPIVRPASREPLSGFAKATLANGKNLFVSELITIAQLREFLAETGYRERRKELTDGIDAPNQDPEHLPATVNWFDALAYTSWFELKSGRPVRLLKIAEYKELHPGPLSADEYKPCPPMGDPCLWRFAEGCVDFRLRDGALRQKWGWIARDEAALFRGNLKWSSGAGNLKFIRNIGFGEWLFEHNGYAAAAVHTVHLRSIHDGYDVERDFMPAQSWGKYRCCKIGFRLCYEAE